VTKSELSQLIIIIYASERRADAPSRSVVEAWHPQLEHFDFQDALQVVSQYYAAQDRPITLNQLCTGLRKKRAERQPVDLVREKTLVPDADPDDPLAYLDALKQRRYLPARDPEDYTAKVLEFPKLRSVESEEPSQPKTRPRRWWLLRGKSQGVDEGE
jgi:hypothetical protein